MSHLDKLMLEMEEQDEEYPSTLQVWRTEEGLLELCITFYMEAQSLVLTHEQETKLKRLLIEHL